MAGKTAAEHYAIGLRHLETRNWRAAETALAQAYEQAQPEFRPIVLQAWGQCALELGDAAAAINRFGAAVQSNPQHAPHAIGLAKAHDLAGRHWSSMQALAYAASISNDREIVQLQTANALKRGDPETAFVQASRLGEQDGANLKALELRGISLLDGGYLIEALSVFDQILKHSPKDRAILYQRILALIGLGDFDASIAALDNFKALHGAPPAIRQLRARAIMEHNDPEAAHALLMAELDSGQASVGCIGLLLRLETLLKGSQGLIARSKDILRTVGHQEKYAVVVLDALRSAEQFDAAFRLLEQLDVRHRSAPEMIQLEAALYEESGKSPEQALHLLDPLTPVFPESEAFAVTRLRALLRLGQFEPAAQIVKEWRDRKPKDQFWLGYLSILLRATGQKQAYDHLCDYNAHVRVFELAAPDGYASIEAFNAALASALDPLFPCENTPMDQSMRGGSQTIRSLVHEQHPVLQAYFEALRTPISQYLNEFPAQSHHPVSVRQTEGIQYQGAWSVRLRGGGRHVNHVHSQGWISASYYVATPQADDRGDDLAGCIKFGEPPIPVPGIEGAERVIRPRAGQVVLFPSFFWHGVVPTTTDALRMTAPFDVAPRWDDVPPVLQQQATP